MRLLFPCRVTAAAALVFAASACSSTFGSLPAPSYVVRNASVERAADNASTRPGYATLRLRIWVPGRTHDSVPHRALPAYVSSATRKVAVTVQGANQSTPTTQKLRCTAVCSGKIVAPLGVDLITLQLEDKKNRVLSRGSATVLVFKNNANVFDFTLDGVPASVALVPESNVLPVVPASTGYVNFDARDADGRIITPDGHYVDANGNPLVFDVKSSNRAYHLAVTAVSAPGAPIPFSYNGSSHVGKVTLTAKAARGIHTTVTFHPATLTLVPGISKRISPPVPMDVLMATQVPIPNGSFANPNATFVVGNSGGQQVALALNLVTGAYGAASYNGGLAGPFVYGPVDLGAGGFSGYFQEQGSASASFGVFAMAPSGAFYGGSSQPCSTGYNAPIGYDASSYLLCTQFIGWVVYDVTNSTVAASGFERKIRTFGTTDYIVTSGSSSTLQVYSYAAKVSTLVSGAIGVGANVTSPSTGYFGDQDGTVKVIGGSTVATFSHSVDNVVGRGSAIYVTESGRIFGVSNPSGTFESAPLSIGNVIEVVTGVGGTPVLVESDGTLDVMRI